MRIDLDHLLMEASASEFFSWLETLPDEAVAAALHARFRHDRAAFLAYCFPTIYRGRFHAGRLRLLDFVPEFAPVPDREGVQCFAVEAPRGLAKTSLLKGIILHHAAVGLDTYAMWGGPSQPEAERESGHLRSCFEHPSDEFAALYGPFHVSGGVRDWRVEFPGGREFKLSARGALRGTYRGSNFRSVRPGLIVWDDVEDPKTVENARIRDELSEKLQSDVLQAGPDTGGLVFIQGGTRLHPDSQTARNAKNLTQFRALHMASVISWPERQDLWNQCRDLWSNLDDPAREETARAFYVEHRDQMDRGAAVLDEKWRSLWDLYVLRWKVGDRAFFKDQQNAPRAGTQALFDMERARRCHLDEEGWLTTAGGKRIHVNQMRHAFALDPRNSDAVSRNDFASIAWVARDDAGYRYVLAVDMKRDNPSGGRGRMWRWFERGMRQASYGYEDNGAQVLHGESFDREREDRQRCGLPHEMNPTPIKHNSNKIDRIGRLQPDIENGWLQFADDLSPEVWQQFCDLPNGAHDDGPDSVEMADAMLAQSKSYMAEATRGPRMW